MTTDNYSFFEEWSDAEHKIDRAHDFYEKGQWQDALRELEGAIAINPTNSNWYFNKGLTLDTLERFQEAIDAFEEAHALNPDDNEILNCLGVDYTRLGRYELALKAFETIEGQAPEFEPCYCNRIITYSEMGRHEEAEEMFYLARQLKEHCPLCYYNMGNSLFSQQLYERAIWCWQQTRKLDPDHPQIEFRIGQAYWAKGDHRAAQEHFLSELRRHPGDIEVLMDTGLLLLEMEELESAKEKFNRVLELDPHHPSAYHYLGEFYYNSGQIPRAIECFHNSLKYNSRLNGSHMRLGQCHLKLGHQANAREHFLKELSFSPSQPDVLMVLGKMLAEVGAVNESMNCFERVIQAQPLDHEAYHNLSLCYYQNGLYYQGVDLSLQVLELQPDYIPALCCLVHAYLFLKEYDKSRQYIELALDLAPENNQVKLLRRSVILAETGSRLIGPLKKVLAPLASDK